MTLQFRLQTTDLINHVEADYDNVRDMPAVARFRRFLRMGRKLGFPLASTIHHWPEDKQLRYAIELLVGISNDFHEKNECIPFDRIEWNESSFLVKDARELLSIAQSMTS